MFSTLVCPKQSWGKRNKSMQPWGPPKPTSFYLCRTHSPYGTILVPGLGACWVSNFGGLQGQRYQKWYDERDFLKMKDDNSGETPQVAIRFLPFRYFVDIDFCWKDIYLNWVSPEVIPSVSRLQAQLQASKQVSEAGPWKTWGDPIIQHTNPYWKRGYLDNDSSSNKSSFIKLLGQVDWFFCFEQKNDPRIHIFSTSSAFGLPLELWIQGIGAWKHPLQRVRYTTWTVGGLDSGKKLVGWAIGWGSDGWDEQWLYSWWSKAWFYCVLWRLYNYSGRKHQDCNMRTIR